MITAEWDIPFQLLTPGGNLGMNQQMMDGSEPLGWYILDPAACSAGYALRVTRTNVSQSGGEIIHRKFRTGYVAQLTMQLWEDPDDKPACAGVLRAMVDFLSLCLNSIENDEGRLQWTPSVREFEAPLPDRMLSPVRLLGDSGSGPGSFVTMVEQKDDGNEVVSVTFALLTDFPYGRDAPEIDTALGGSGGGSGSSTTTVDNGGNSEVYPIFEVEGPTDAFSITNLSNLDEQGNPRSIVYLGDALPGGIPIAGGHFAEIDCFRNTIYLDGHFNNLKPGIDILASDFWTILPGENDIEIVGASATMKWQNAYA